MQFKILLHIRAPESEGMEGPYKNIRRAINPGGCGRGDAQSDHQINDATP
jgi:hypothetical protein